MRSGKNALETIDAVKAKLAGARGRAARRRRDRPDLRPLDADRRAVANLGEKLVEEFVVVALVCLVFLFHLRSALVAIVSLPLGVLMAFIVMHYQGVNANIMSLGGIAIAIGAMVDAAVVMIENAHKHLERVAPRARRGSTAGRGAVARHRRGRGRGRAGAVLLPAHHHAVVRPGVHARGAGRAAVRAARVHQDLRDGGRRPASPSRWCRC